MPDLVTAKNFSMDLIVALWVFKTSAYTSSFKRYKNVFQKVDPLRVGGLQLRCNFHSYWCDLFWVLLVAVKMTCFYIRMVQYFNI